MINILEYVILQKWEPQQQFGGGGRSSLCALTSHLTSHLPFPNRHTLSPPYRAQHPKPWCWLQAQNTWLIRLPFQEIPEWFLSLCPQLVKKGERKTNRYQHPAVTWHGRKSGKINVIHNLYHLTLARTQPLGLTLRWTVLLGWIWDSCTRCQDWCPLVPQPSDKEMPFPLQGLSDPPPPKKRREQRGKQPLSTPLWESPLAREAGNLSQRWAHDKLLSC